VYVLRTYANFIFDVPVCVSSRVMCINSFSGTWSDALNGCLLLVYVMSNNVFGPIVGILYKVEAPFLCFSLIDFLLLMKEDSNL